jgi:hypothetical protein
MVFGSPGTYDLTIRGSSNILSNVTSVKVAPSGPGEKGLALLSDPQDKEFLVHGRNTGAQTVAHLEAVVKTCSGTVLAQVAAARLGLEEMRQLEEKYPNGEEFLVKYQQGAINEPLVDRIQSHLTDAYKLPDRFPVREAVLSGLAAVELVRGNSEKSFLLLDELAARFPNGRYGGRATATKAGYKSLLDRIGRSAPPSQPNRGQEGNRNK